MGGISPIGAMGPIGLITRLGKGERGKATGASRWEAIPPLARGARED